MLAGEPFLAHPTFETVGVIIVVRAGMEVMIVPPTEGASVWLSAGSPHVLGTGERVVSSSWASAMSAAHSSIRVSLGLMHGGSGSSCGNPGDWRSASAVHSSDGWGCEHGVALGESATEEIIPMTEGLCRSELEVGDDNSSGWGRRDEVCNEGSLWGF
ncbi:hypothetical protein BGY98DRAFT_937578 [Russula aff. rugulosa BPL654]|nr:hypothetical protein BGY98DRAFT_937578 [Russula aff. rugulosa BPL654]